MRFTDYKKETIERAKDIIKEQILTDYGGVCGYIDINGEECEQFIEAIQYLMKVIIALEELNKRLDTDLSYTCKELRTQEELAEKIVNKLFDKLKGRY